MQEAYKTAELIDILGISKMSVTRKAKREGWHSQPRKGRGGGNEWIVSSMPESTREAIYSYLSQALPAAQEKNEIAIVEETSAVQDINHLKKWQRDIFEARLALYQEFVKLQGLFGTTRAVKKMVTMAQTDTFPEHLQGLVTQANARPGKNKSEKGTNRSLSRSMILGWQRKVKESGLIALAPASMEKKKIPLWAPYFLKIYQKPQKPSLAQAREDLKEILPENIDMPSYAALVRWNNKRHAVDREKGRHSSQALKAFKGFCRRSTDNLLPLDIGQIDGHSVKMRVAHPETGRPFHPEICGVIDWRTRVCTGWWAWLSESAQTVGGAIIHSLTVNEKKPYGGTYAMLYADKGAGNTSHIISDEHTGLLTRCGTEFVSGIPGNSQGRGLIEKSNQSLWINMAKKSLTYTGKDMDKKTAREIYLVMDREVKKTGTCMNEALPSWQQFLQMAQETVDNYNRRPHRGLPKITDPRTGQRRHMCPLEMWAQHLAEGWQPSQLPQEIVADMMRPQTVRKVRRCEVNFLGNIYYSKDLEGYHGREVVVEYDVHDPMSVKIRDLEQRMVCQAIWNANKRDAYPVSQVEKNRQERAARRMKLIDFKREEIEAEAKGGIVDITSSEIDMAAVERQLKSGPTPQIGHDALRVQIPDEIIINQEPEAIVQPAAVSAQPERVQQLYCATGTLTEMYFLIKRELEEYPRPLNQRELVALDEFYETDNGRLLLSIEGDLREIAGRSMANGTRL